MKKLYRVETSHWVEHRQVERQNRFRANSDRYAQEVFFRTRKNDPTLQEGALFRESDGELIAEYIGCA